MNSKLIKASLAGVAAIAVAAGGNTFATFSDTAVVADNTSGAGILRLDLDDPVTMKFDNIRLAPHDGTNGPYNYYENEFFLASNDGDSVPLGDLSLTYSNLKNIEGDSDADPWGSPADNCTTQSEKTAEGGPCGPPGELGNAGEFGSQATFRTGFSAPMAVGAYVPGTCAASTYTYLTTANNALDDGGLPGFTPDPYPTVELANALPAGQGVCVIMQMSLPSSATNASQGDSISWDTTINLIQDITP